MKSFTWVGGSGGNWTDESNWDEPSDEGGFPGAEDEAMFESDATINLGSASVYSLRKLDPEATFTLSLTNGSLNVASSVGADALTLQNVTISGTGSVGGFSTLSMSRSSVNVNGGLGGGQVTMDRSSGTVDTFNADSASLISSTMSAGFSAVDNLTVDGSSQLTGHATSRQFIQFIVNQTATIAGKVSGFSVMNILQDLQLTGELSGGRLLLSKNWTIDGNVTLTDTA